MELLELRRRIKKKKPNFIRKDAHKKKRLGNRWVRPKGLQNKLRLGKRGHIKKVSSGYGSPRAVKGLDRTGLQMVVVHNNVEGIDPKKQGIIISSKVGMRKKLDIIKMALSKGIKILNIKEPESYAKKAEEAIKKRKELKDTKKKRKEDEVKKRKSDKKKESIEKTVSEEENKEEDKKEQEKKEMEKVLTKRT